MADSRPRRRPQGGTPPRSTVLGGRAIGVVGLTGPLSQAALVAVAALSLIGDFFAKYAIAKAGVYAYPNPANTAVNFHFTSAAGEAEVEVFDISGRLVKKLSNVSADTVVPGVNSKKIAWDMSGESIASGVYLYILRVRDSSTGETEKVVKKFAVIR